MEQTMKDLIAGFSDQLREALKIGSNAKFKKAVNPIHNVVITGLGGSGIGGTIISQVVENNISVPVLVNKDYFLPAYVNENTLLIVSSYSGNTEETLNAMNIAFDKKALIVCISSGGTVTELAQKHELDYIAIPGGMPPRSCIAYSLTQLFYVLNGFNLIDDTFINNFENAIKLLDEEEEHIKSEAFYLAEKLHKKIPIIYSQSNYEGVSIRFRQQINENSKMLCWHHVLPEMNHNELVGWTQQNDKLAVVLFRNETDFDRTQARMELSKGIIAKCTPNIYEVYSKGNSIIERVLYLVHFGDWVSLYLSEIKGIDATEVNVINFLKAELSKA
jgi:glucose/mannose-6-phosphate isomerase